MKIDGLLRFSKFLNALARINRVYRLPGTERSENDAEHSYHLAMTAWYLISTTKLDLDLTKVLTYALAHDLVEVYAGDTYIYSTDAKLLESKKEREAEARKRIGKEFPEFPDLHAAIDAYEARKDRESRFVYALDKVLPLMIIREDNGHFWQKLEVTLDMLVTNKAPKVALSPEIEPYFNELVAMLREEKIMYPG